MIFVSRRQILQIVLTIKTGKATITINNPSIIDRITFFIFFSCLIWFSVFKKLIIVKLLSVNNITKDKLCQVMSGLLKDVLRLGRGFLFLFWGWRLLKLVNMGFTLPPHSLFKKHLLSVVLYEYIEN